MHLPAAAEPVRSGSDPAPVLDAAFESLRTLATPAAADYLIAFLDPSHQTTTDNATQRNLLSGIDAGTSSVRIGPRRTAWAAAYSNERIMPAMSRIGDRLKRRSLMLRLGSPSRSTMTKSLPV